MQWWGQIWQPNEARLFLTLFKQGVSYQNDPLLHQGTEHAPFALETMGPVRMLPFFQASFLLLHDSDWRPPLSVNIFSSKQSNIGNLLTAKCEFSTWKSSGASTARQRASFASTEALFFSAMPAIRSNHISSTSDGDFLPKRRPRQSFPKQTMPEKLARMSFPTHVAQTYANPLFIEF